MANRGWICLDRNILSHWVYEDPVMFKIWIWILLNANHEDKKCPIGGELFTVKRGQKYTSINKISIEVKCSRSKVKRTLDAFVSDNMITLERIKSGTLLTVIKYEVFQDRRNNKKQQNDNEGDNTRYNSRYTNNNINNDINNDKQKAANFSPFDVRRGPVVYED